MELTKELLAKAKRAESAEALQALAGENGCEMSEEEAKAYFAELHKSGELSDEELRNVSGGGCRKNGHLVVTVMNSCKQWTCKNDGSEAYAPHIDTPDGMFSMRCRRCGRSVMCSTCKYCRYEKGLWLCYNPEK